MNRLMQFFKHDHLPPHLQEPSKSCAELATKMDETLAEGAEKTAGLRKLLEAKDCFVRAVLEAGPKAGAILALLLMCTTLPALAGDWNTSSATGSLFVVQEERAADPADKPERKVTAVFIEGINFQHTRIPLGFTLGGAALRDEDNTLPRPGFLAAAAIGTPRFRFEVGGLYDWQNVEEKARAIFQVSFSPEEILGG